MAEQSREREGVPTDGPSDVQITVTVEPHAHRDLVRKAFGRTVSSLSMRTIVPVTLALAVLGSAIAVVLLAGGTSAAPSAGTRSAESAKIAAAFGYRYPRRCLTITLFPGAPDFAHAHVDRTGPCARYHGYVNATFHLVDGTWRLVLDEGQLFVPNSSLER